MHLNKENDNNKIKPVNENSKHKPQLLLHGAEREIKKFLLYSIKGKDGTEMYKKRKCDIEIQKNGNKGPVP